MQSDLKTIPVNLIILDNNNPRLTFAKLEKGLRKWSVDSMSKEIIESIPFNHLLTSIKQIGVIDPIWVLDLGNKKYQVIEGNMRLTALKELIRNKTKSPSGIDFTVISAHIVDKNTSKTDIDIQKAVLQMGKNPWGAFNEASHIYELFWKRKLKIPEIAEMLGKSETYISNEIDNFNFYKEFIEFAKHKKLSIDPNKYSFFKDASGNVRKKMFQTKTSRQKYFELIVPNKHGITRLPNISLKNGLRIFAKFVNDERILTNFLQNQKISVEDAYLGFKEKNATAKKPWLKKIPAIINGLHKLTKNEREELIKDRATNSNLKQLRNELNRFLGSV